MTISRIPEIIVPGKRLGRHIDERTTSARSAGGPPLLAKAIISVKHAAGPGMPLNQGDVGSCTGNALCGALNSRPHWAAGNPTLNEADALKVYSEEGVLDGNGPYPPNDNGGTGQYVCEAAINLGWCNSFQVASGIDEALRALVLRPVITGINWYTSFDSPPADGVISIAKGASVRGGHEICADEIDAVNELVWFWQSWGLGFGLNGSGRFAMRFGTWETLLGQGGDVTVPRTARGWTAPSAALAA